MPISQAAGRTILLAPSVLSANFAQLGEQAQAAEAAGADWLQVDVMDGVFVPNITVGPLIVEALRRAVRLMLDAHLMIVQPERYIAEFVRAGAGHITVHVEACTHLHRTIQQIKELGATAGVALNPATSLHTLDEILPDLDLVLIMSVNPGFGGQAYIPASTQKIAQLRRILAERKLEHIQIQVDGGIKSSNIATVVEAGATNIVAGSAVFNQKQTVAEAIAQLREACR